MAAGIDMFGAGGEALGGLFMGNQMAMQRDAAEMERQKALVDMANTQEITRQRQLGNEYESAILGDKIQGFKDAATKTKEADQLEKFNRQGEQFGRLGQVLSGLPGAARPAALKQLAAQAGIGEDNPLLQQLMGADPEALPDIMSTFSKGFFEQGEKARVEKMKREEMAALKKTELEAKAEEGRLNREQKAELAREGNALRRDIAGMVQAGANQRAAARGAGAGAGKDPLMNLTTDKAISYLELKKATEGELSAAEEQALVNLKQFKLNQAVVKSPGTTEDIMGLESPAARAAGMAGGTQPTKTTPAAPAKKGTQQFQEGKVYQDAAGNKARFEKGKWVPVGGSTPEVPK